VRRLASALPVVSVVAARAGCGGSSADLFVVTRTPESGSGASALTPLTLVVSDGGTVTCNGKQRQLPGSLLLDARQLQRDLDSAATAGEVLPAGPRPVYAYSVRTPAGTLAFADDSPHQPNAFQRLAYFTLQVDQQVCSRAG
jgi:hypothetical protein